MCNMFRLFYTTIIRHMPNDGLMKNAETCSRCEQEILQYHGTRQVITLLIRAGHCILYHCLTSTVGSNM